MKRRAKKLGFTLIELLVVITLIGILSGGVFLLMRSAGDKANIAKTTQQVHALAGLLDMYKNEYGSYPVVTAQYMDSNDDPIGYACVEFHFVSGEGDDVHLSYGTSDSLTNVGSGLTFKIKDGNGERTVKNAKYIRGDKDEMTFGLCSHFVPKAYTIMTSVQGNAKTYYERVFSEPQEETPYAAEGMRGGGGTDALENAAAAEMRAPSRVYDEWTRLLKDGLVYGQNTVNIETGSMRYTAGANSDAWGNPLVYRNEGGAGEIVSAGPDRIYGTADDITSGGGAVDEGDDE